MNARVSQGFASIPMLKAGKKVTTRLYLCRLVHSFEGVYNAPRCPENSFTISEMNGDAPPSRRRILPRSLAAHGKDGCPGMSAAQRLRQTWRLNTKRF